MAVPYTFGSATSAIPLSQLDSNFSTAITIGNTAVQLGNTVSTLNNMTLANVTVSTGNVTVTNATITTANVTTTNIATSIITTSESLSYGTANGVGYLNASKVLTTGSALTFDGTNFATSGTASAAKLIPTGSSATGNGLYLPAANALGLSTNGTNAIYIDSSQNVGIGTSSPIGLLDVSSNSNSTVRYYFRNASAGTGAYTILDLGNDTSNQRGELFVTSSGNTSSWGANSLVLSNSGAFPVLFATNNSERMRIDSSGNVGIGTSAPGAKLDVRGSSTFLVNATNPTAWISVDSGLTTGSIYSQFNTSSNIGISGTYTNHPYALYTNNTERMRIDSSGNVGIGTSSPNASAILDAQSTTKGVRMPNMTTTQKNAIASPAAGLMVFDTTLAKLCVYSGSAWQTITSV